MTNEEELRNHGGGEYPAYNKNGKVNRIGHILRRNFLLKRITEGKIERGIQVTRRDGRRRKLQLDDLKERREYCKLKEEEATRTMRITCFGRDY